MTQQDDDYHLAVGELVVGWGRLEEQFRRPNWKPSEVLVDIPAVAAMTGLSEDQVHRVRKVRNQASHSGRTRPTPNDMDEALGILEMVWTKLEPRPGRSAPTSRKKSRPMKDRNAPTLPPTLTAADPEPPTTYSNPKGDNPWDNDAVHWLLDQFSKPKPFKRGPLMECLRRQPAQVLNQPHRVLEAEELALLHGVIQREEFDPRRGKTMVRLYRTDSGRPVYPGTPPTEAVRSR